MYFNGNNLYHIYNRSFNHHPIFMEERNYSFFLDKIFGLRFYCDILAYCLMYNHFHLMVSVPENSPGLNFMNGFYPVAQQILTRKIGTALSSYTQAFNKQEGRVGSLFQPKTNALELHGTHPLTCFHYIHQNPLKANLVSKLEDWPYSSFNEYFRATAGLCNKNLAQTLLGIPASSNEFYYASYQALEYDFENH